MKKALLIHPEELSRSWVDRMKAVGCRTLALHPTGGDTAHESARRLEEKMHSGEFRALLDYAADHGLQIEYQLHALGYFLPRTLFAEHPEYFRMNEAGQRVADGNFCVCNEEAMDRVAEQAAGLARKLYRSTNRYFFWLDDLKDRRCMCPKCAGLTASDQQMMVMNRILKQLRQDDENATLAYLAYFDCTVPPVKVRPDEGIFLEYAPFERDFSKSVAQMPQAERENICRLLEWFGKENSVVLEYWFDNSLFSRWKKPPVQFTPNNDMIRGDFGFYRDLGFEELSSFACFLGADYEELYGQADISAFADA